MKRLAWLALTAFTWSAVHAAPAANSTGEQVFNRHCAYCHGEGGQGSQPWYPAMQRLARLRTPGEMVDVVLSGKFQRAGEFQGHTIPVMPAWSRLADADIAAIINYIQHRWGEGEGRVTAEEVAAHREGLLEGVRTPATNASPSLAAAKAIYFDRCVGCHGVAREGASGAALLPWAMRVAGTQSSKTMIHYGTSDGMPGFGVSEDLSAREMELLAEYLAQDVPDPPPFTDRDIRASHTRLPPVRGVDSAAGPDWSVDDLFVSLRHDIGGVVLIDGNTKKVIAQIDTDRAPHDIAVSDDQRFLYVLSRGGRIAQIDLASNPPRKTAEVRAGLEARSLTTSRIGKTAIVAASTFYPGHVVLLRGDTLAPMSVLDPRPEGTTSGNFRLSQIVDVPGRAEIVIAAKDQGFVHYVDTSGRKPLLQSVPTKKFLRSGSLDPSGRYFVIPTDDEELIVFDVQSNSITNRVLVPGLSGASKGVFYDDPDDGPVWVASAMAADTLTFLYADPGKSDAWRVLRRIKTAGAGSLYVVAHPSSPHLWFDAPLNSSPAISGSVYAVDRRRPEAGYTQLPVLDILGDEFAGGRVLHPQFNKTGTELWVTVWNRQDQTSAVVVIDDATQEVKTVIDDPRLITPIRSYALWQFKKQPYAD